MEAEGLLELWSYDETAFHLNPNQIMVWVAPDNRPILPAQRGNILSVAGFIKTNNEFEGYEYENTITDELFIKFIEDFISKRVKKKTVIIIDGASAHKSKKVMQKQKEWKINKREGGGGGPKKFRKLISGGGRLFGSLE